MLRPPGGSLWPVLGEQSTHSVLVPVPLPSAYWYRVQLGQMYPVALDLHIEELFEYFWVSE